MTLVEISPMKELFQNLLKLQDLEFADARDSSAEAAISQLRRKIPLPILEHYDRLTVRGKKGVAIVRNQVCTGCHMRIPIGAINTLMHGDNIQMCETCGRYLYLPPDVSTPAPSLVIPGPGKAGARRAVSAAPNRSLAVPVAAKAPVARGRPKHKPLMRTA